MTECSNSITLKSSSCNQDGQNYFEQLAAYVSMSSHLRRILLARSVIDTKNKKYIYERKQQIKMASHKSYFTKQYLTHSRMNRSMYNIQDYIMQNHRPTCCSQMKYKQEVNISQSRSTKNNYTDLRNWSTFLSYKTNLSKQATNFNKVQVPCEQHHNFIDEYNVSEFCDQALQRKNKAKERHVDTACRPVTKISQASSLSSPIEDIGYTPLSSSILNYTENEVQPVSFQQLLEKKDKARYTKFIYDITQEIMQNGLYTDSELQNVFRKHIKQNKHILDTRKMLFEIYQLKISLNILDDLGMDNDSNTFICTHKTLKTSKARPLTPPKIVYENKVVEKLLYFQNLLQDPLQAQKILKSLLQERSKAIEFDQFKVHLKAGASLYKIGEFLETHKKDSNEDEMFEDISDSSNAEDLNNVPKKLDEETSRSTYDLVEK